MDWNMHIFQMHFLILRNLITFDTHLFHIQLVAQTHVILRKSYSLISALWKISVTLTDIDQNYIYSTVTSCLYSFYIFRINTEGL